MPEPLTLTPPAAPAATQGTAPAPAAGNAADSPAAGDFSRTLAALTTAPAPTATAPTLPDGGDTPPPLAPPPAGIRLPLPGKILPSDASAGTAPTKGKGKPKTDDQPATDPASPPDGTGMAPAMVLIAIPQAEAAPPPVTAPLAPSAAPAMTAAIPAPAPRKEAAPAPRGAAPQAAALATAPATMGLQLRAAFADGNEASAHGHAAGTQGDVPAAAAPAPAAPQFALAMAADPAPAAIGPISHALPAGQDLSALVERLVEARGAAQAGNAAGPVSTTVNHAEFGRIAVHFAPDSSGLNVTLSSPDPAFAGAAQAALAVGSAQSGEGTQLFDGRGTGGGSPGSTGQDAPGSFAGQGNGGSGNPAARAEPPIAPARSSAPASAPASTSDSDDIFA